MNNRDNTYCTDSCCNDKADAHTTTSIPISFDSNFFTNIDAAPDICNDECCEGPTSQKSEPKNDCNDSCCDHSQDNHDNSDTVAITSDSCHNLQVFEIEGMDCSSCALTLHKHVSRSLGINDVNVNFSTAKMKLSFDGDVEKVLKAVEEAGYKARTVQQTVGISEQEPHQSSWLKDSGVKNTLVSGIALLIGFITSFFASEQTAILFYAISMIIAGYKPAKNAFYAISSRSLDMNVLMSVAAVGAAILGEWLEGATVVFLFGLGNALQTISIDKTRKSIQSLMSLAPNEAIVIQGNKLVKKSIHEIRVGDILLVQPGDRIPLDGVIKSGTSEVNQAPITGESLPVAKSVGDEIFAGTINESGALEVHVTKLVGNTALARIIHLVEEAQEKKAPTEQFVDKFARIYTPFVFVFAFGIMIVPPLFFGGWSEWIYRGLELLVIACPCALVISTPVSVVSAIGNAARNGVLIKGGAALEVAGRITHVAFDKTGTLTEGKPSVSEVVALRSDENTVLSIVRAIEERSKHPIAQAIVAYTNEKVLPHTLATDHQAIAGKGASALIDGKKYYAGNERLFFDLGVYTSQVQKTFQKWQSEGKSVVLIGDDTHLLGLVAVSDTIRETSADTIHSLRRANVSSVMLTGDNGGSAAYVAKKIGITDYKAELLPDQKLEEITKLKKSGTIAMIGDGINDAPALATADIGIAMGGAGTDTAMETADVVLMADNLEKLPHMISLSQSAIRIIKQNIWFSIIIKALAIALIVPNWLTLWIAVLSDTGAAMIVILNSMRLLRK